MKLPSSSLFFAGCVVAYLFTFKVFAQNPGEVAAPPVYVPDISHQNEPLPDGVLAFDATMKSVDLVGTDDPAKFVFNFTNVSPDIVTLLVVHPSCGCTTAEMPPVPWQVAPGTNAAIKLTVDVTGKQGMLFKSVKITTDRGQRDLMLRINITPPPKIVMTDEQRAAGLAAAKADRQAVFKGECVKCHVKKVEGKYGQQAYEAVCAICHNAEHRAEMVPDLAQLPGPTNEEFWRTWITYGKPGSLMPAFAQSQGGPLTDLQIASLASYLNAIYPSKPATNAPAK